MLNEIMSTFTPAQQALLKSLVTGEDVKVEDVHPSTITSLSGQGIIAVEGEFVVLSDEFVDDIEDTPPSEETPEAEVEADETEFMSGSVKNTILMMRLSQNVVIQVSANGQTATLPIGSMHPVIGYSEEVTTGRHPKRIKWYTVYHVPTQASFLMNGSGHQLVEVDKDDIK